MELTREAGCPLHLAHATMNFGVNKGKAPDLLALLDAALADGADISLDTYPYTPGCTTLVAMLPSWASEGGPDDDPEAAAGRRDRREASGTTWRSSGADGCHGVPIEWDTIEISGVSDPGLASCVGRTVQESADLRGEAPWVTARRLLIDDTLGSTILQHVGHEENVRAIMQHPVHTGGSDGILQGSKPHPRAYGTFPHYLGRYVRELGILSLEESRRPPHVASRGPAAPGRPRPGPRGLPRRPGPLRPGDGRGGLHVRGAAHAPRGHPARPDRREVRDRGRAPHGRTRGAVGPPDGVTVPDGRAGRGATAPTRDDAPEAAARAAPRGRKHEAPCHTRP